MSKHYRRGATFVDTRQCFRPVDRNRKYRLLMLAEGLEHRTKGRGCRQGALGHIGIKVFRALLLTFLDAQSGRCDPSYEAIAKRANVCHQSVANALARLEATGMLTIVRRIVRELEDGVLKVRQASNCYSFSEPHDSSDVARTAAKVRSFPSATPPLLAWLNSLAPKPSLLSRGDSATDLRKRFSGGILGGGYAT
jgi:hypothetical protein